MMTALRLNGLAQRGEWDGLLTAVLGNGRPVPLSVRMRLASGSEGPGDAAGGAAMGLALCRVVELTYLPGDEGSSIATMLMGLQGDDGWFGSVAATACAAAGLRAYEEQLEAGGGAEREELRRVTAAADAAMHALITRTMDGRSGADRQDLAILLWALCGRTRAGEAWWMAERRDQAESMGLAHDASLSPMVVPALVRSGSETRGVAA